MYGLGLPEWTSAPEFRDAVALLLILGALVAIVGLWLVREGRNEVLEQILVEKDFGNPEGFRGSLVVEEYRRGNYLRIAAHTPNARWLRFKYHWLVGMGRQAVFDEVTFDRSTATVTMKRKNHCEKMPFSDLSAVRMSERAAGRSLVSLWHVELIPRKGRPIPIATSLHGDRAAVFDETAKLLKAVSSVTDLSMQAWVAGNVWTRGWPPKGPSDSA
jgi:hypothetical protein